MAIPNVASDTANIRRNIEFLTAAFAKRGVAMRPLRAPTGGSPALFGELKAPGATRTIVMYAHYDGQPVAGGGWNGDPFTPELRRYENSVATAEFRKASDILSGLWEKVRERPSEFLDAWTIEHEGLDAATRDFIAGMTDRYAVRLFEQLYIPKPWAID